jgi:hypothetical protein
MTEPHHAIAPLYLNGLAVQQGFSKREAFAAMMMQGALSDSRTVELLGAGEATGAAIMQQLASYALLAADTLIAELNK